VRKARFLHVSFAAIPSNQDSVDAVIESESFDWFRYTPNAYIVWSSSDAETICMKLRRLPELGGRNIFVCAVDMSDGFGSFPQWGWDWIRKDRGSGTVNTWEPSTRLTLPPPPKLEY
jgi:hypothetical protein